MFKKPYLLLYFVVSVIGLGQPVLADTLKVGVLKFGTVNWELDVIKHHGLDKKHGFNLEVTGLGSKNATSVALQSGDVDMIVTDYFWAGYQRSKGSDHVFYPHSHSVGAVITRPDAGINDLKDLAGQKLGIAGGPVDKSWLLLQSYYQKNTGESLQLEPQFAAPPLLNKLIARGELDAVLNFWHYTARLQSDGMNTLVSMQDIQNTLGVERPVAMIGWVFSESFAKDNEAMVSGFLSATREAKQIMNDSDAEWQRLKKKTKAKNDTMLVALRDAYRAGIPKSFNAADRESAVQLYDILAAQGGEKLVGTVTELPDGVFWTGKDF